MTEGRFDPLAILRSLNSHGVNYIVIGGFAATAYGSPLPTTDIDVTPEPSEENLARLSQVLYELEACVRVEGIRGGVPFSHSADSLRDLVVLNLVTRFGDLDLVMKPLGAVTYLEMESRVLTVSVHETKVPLAALSDIVASKTAADRPKDRHALPLLRALLERLSREDSVG